jgi:hypothetical protein
MKRPSPKTTTLLGMVAAGVAGLAVYVRCLRPWQLRWGATDEEVARPMPGDDIVQHPHFNATRAVTIHARPEHIWPWLLQMGIGRAGWYSYDIVDNLGRPSARCILPEWQNVKVGDLVPMSPVGEMGLYVRAFEPNRWLLWDDKGQGKTTWVWGLYPIDDQSTRLISRVRLRYDWLSPSILFNLLLDMGDIVMMRKCMLGIKERSEALDLVCQITPPVLE